ncbi:MAG: DUF1684 domain-containing protein [Planctomycetaceae bacterium]|nr:DUF1684 domain-containing protein [Planctomycetaceae bacterium]
MANDESPATYEQQVLTWRQKRLERLKSPEGWLAVSGLIWLDEPKEQTDYLIGSSEGSHIRLSAESSPASAGRVNVRDGIVSFTINDGVEATLNGQTSRGGILQIDPAKPEADSPDKLQVGHTSIHLIRRSGRLAIRLRDAKSPLIRDFPGEDWYPVDAGYRVTAKFEPYNPPRPIQITNVRGATYEDHLVGFVEFQLNGQSIRLECQEEGPDDLFIVFRDATSGKETYGAGRFLNAKKSADGQVVLDFNQTYNPPCAYNTHTLCPLPPRANHLSVAIPAGAKKPLASKP